MEPATSWFLVGFASAASRRDLPRVKHSCSDSDKEWGELAGLMLPSSPGPAWPLTPIWNVRTKDAQFAVGLTDCTVGT